MGFQMKKFITFIITAIFPFMIFAIPGTVQYIPDISGEYVYYCDRTFKRESYIGIITYDESTYQIRYFAPVDKENQLPEKQVALLITIDPEANFWKMTGEKIVYSVLPDSDDADIINYLHDILYEFSARRIKEQAVESFSVESTQDFEQFGGNVKITFDATIPIFNIRTIQSQSGEKVFECLTTGKLKATDDTSFDNFKGFPPINDKVKYKNIKKQKENKITFEGHSLILDESWEQKLDNFWTFENESIIVFSVIPQVNKDKNKDALYIIRKILTNENKVYPNRADAVFEYDDDKNHYKIAIWNFLSENNDYVRNVMVLTKNAKDGFDFFTMATYKNAYLKHKSYFDKIEKSYK